MLTLDVIRMSHAELADAVSERCAEYGRVVEITILQPPEKPEVAFALVGRATENDVDTVVAKLGAAKVASLAVIRIEQEQQIAHSIFSRKVQPDWAALV